MAKPPHETDLTFLQLSEEDREDIIENIIDHIHGPPSDIVPPEHEAAYKPYDANWPQPSHSLPNDFIAWLSSSSFNDVEGSRGSWLTEVGREGAGFFLSLSPTLASKPNNPWQNIQVIGHCCRDNSVQSYQDGLVNLCGYAQHVFRGQPSRLFLHGLYLHGNLVEQWKFDRSGIYCFRSFDAQKEPGRLQCTMHDYRMMTDQELGMSELIKEDEKGRFVVLQDDAATSMEKLYLQGEPVHVSEDIVGEGTTCYLARMPDEDRWGYIVKFKWRRVSARQEEALLKLANGKNAKGIIKLHYDQAFSSTTELRQDHQRGPYRKLLGELDRNEECKDLKGKVNTPSKGKKGILDLTEETEDNFEDRTFVLVVTSPAGRPLQTFKNRLELLIVLRDAVKAHRSLFQDAKILHQDISGRNIIIVDAKNSGDSEGILIDLDAAIELAEASHTQRIFGTRLFMAIGTLKKRIRRYRYDLESFLYVFLWTIIANGEENLPQTSKLRQWSQGSWDDSARLKTSDMDKTNFEDILAEFTPKFHSFKPLARKLRELLFPVVDGELWTGTNGSLEATKELYDGIIGAFEDAMVYERGSAA
ncbi:hypothetical protein FH972_025223 [Carpinus fangiana]|uniref:Fungal-type protein kinase domain-containing protein n=1 Tax=Carpinus fangiana TaxID=176857 RepID=A0A5N6L0M3_9ROSI|nr:hypothetical protein FH972_025223 [Carpinus fangiana]